MTSLILDLLGCIFSILSIIHCFSNISYAALDRLYCMGALWILRLNYKVVIKHIINGDRLSQFRNAFVNVCGSKGDLILLASVVEWKNLFGSANISALKLGELILTIWFNYLMTT